MSTTKFPSTHMNPMFRQFVSLLPWASELCANIVESKDERVAGRRPVASPEQRFRSYLQAHGCDVPRLEAAMHSLLGDGANAAALKEVVSTVADAAAGKQDLGQLVHRLAHCCGVPVPSGAPRPAPAQMSAMAPADAPPGTTWTPGMDPESAWLFSQTLPAPAGAPAPSGYARRGDRFWPLRLRPMPATPPTPAEQPAPAGPPAAAQPTPAPPDPMIGASTCMDPTPQPSSAEPPPRRPRARRFMRRIVVRQPHDATPATHEAPSTPPISRQSSRAAAEAPSTTAEARPVPAGATEGHQLAAVEKMLEQLETTLRRQLEGLEQKLTAKLADHHAKQEKTIAALSERVASLEAQAAARPVAATTPADAANGAPVSTSPTAPEGTTSAETSLQASVTPPDEALAADTVAESSAAAPTDTLAAAAARPVADEAPAAAPTAVLTADAVEPPADAAIVALADTVAEPLANEAAVVPSAREPAAASPAPSTEETAAVAPIDAEPTVPSGQVVPTPDAPVKANGQQGGDPRTLPELWQQVQTLRAQVIEADAIARDLAERDPR